MAKDFAELNRLENEAGIQAPEAGTKEQLVNKFVKAWENETARRAVKGGTGLSMALTLAACGGSSDGGFAFAPSTQGPAPTTPIENLIALVDGGITAITGADPIIEVSSPTAGADALATTIGAGGTGTLELRFADAEDVVTLDAASDLSGYDTLAITSGTVDVTAVDLSGITSITVSSGVTLTAAQFLALDNGVTGGSADSSVTIIVSTAAEAEAVIAAAASLSGTFATNGIVIQGADGSGITAAQAEGFTADLEAAIEAAATVDGLPQAIQAVVDAATAQDAFVETALANDAVVAELQVAEAEAEFDDVDTAIDDAEDQAIIDINAALPQGATAFDGTNSAAIVAEFDAEIGDATTGLTGALNDARDTVAAIDAELVTLANAEISAEAALADAQDAQTAAAQAVDDAMTAAQGEGAAVLSWNEANGTLSSDADGIANNNSPVVIASLDVNGNLVLNNSLQLDQQTSTYSVDGATYDVADIEAVVSAAQAELAAIDATAEAQTARNDAVAATTTAEGAQADADAAETAVDAYIAASGELTAAQDAKAAFETAVQDYNALVSLQEQSTDLVDGLDAAVAGIENGPDADPAGLSIDLVSGVDGDGAVNMASVASADDLYILELADANPAGVIAVSNFAADGLDRIFTGVEGDYTFVELGDQLMTESVGSANVLEIFAEETDAGVTLYIEGIASAGNGTTAPAQNADITVVTLSNGQGGVDGLSVADLTFDAATDILSAEAAVVV
ncbi:autotransporter outer membrane beta-barrel domain-containing protein [Roseovarius sp.]